jgi:general stress protein 26
MTEQLQDPHTSDASEQHSVARVRELIADIKVAMLTTCGADGQMHSRPMYTQETDVDGDLWFMTSKSASLVRQIRENASVLVQYADPDSQRFVVVAGTGAVFHDQGKVDALWNPTLKMWFEGGPTDPEIMLVKIESHSAEYWDSPAAPVRLFQFLAGVATGKPPAGDTRGSVSL